ncbi:MAG: DsbA family protein, partial [Rhodospirillaceae bacterium]
MMSGIRRLVLAALGLLIFYSAAPTRAESSALSDAQNSAIEKLIHSYLVAHPEVLVESMAVLRERQQRTENDDRRSALKSNQAALFEDKASPIAGNPDGDVTLVEFFDYACPYCKTVGEDVKSLLKADGKIKLVLKEFPVLGANSTLAAKAALAARSQNLYLVYHYALMATRGQFNEETLMRVARSVGIDTDRLKNDMRSPEIEAALQ